MIWLFLCMILSSIAAGWLARHYSHWVLIFDEWHYFKRLPKLDMATIESTDPFAQAVLMTHLIAEKTWARYVNLTVDERIQIADIFNGNLQKFAQTQDLSGVRLRRPKR